MFKQLCQFVRVGWTMTKELHEISWFIPWLLAFLGIPVVSIPAWAAWDNPVLRGPLIGLAFLLYAMLFLCALGYVGYRDSKKLPVIIAAAKPIAQSSVNPEFISLADAARSAFSEAESHHPLLAEAANRAFSAPNGPLAYMASHMHLTLGIPIYGKRFPSLNSKPLATDAFFGGDFARNVESIIDEGGSATYTELQMKKDDLAKAIEKIRAPSTPQ